MVGESAGTLSIQICYQPGALRYPMALAEGLSLEESTHRHEKMKQLIQRSDVPPPEKSYHFCGNVEPLLRKCRITPPQKSGHFCGRKVSSPQKSLFILLGGQI